jgi:catechol 2,3-dioxygenase-like lactoylglutathione lyase family enzyme
VLVDDQDKALRFYTEVLGFTQKTDVPVGEHRWITVVSPEDPDGTELLLEPDAHPAAKPFKEALVADGIPLHRVRRRRRQGGVRAAARARVRLTQEPAEMGPVTTAVFDDTCGNLTQIAHQTGQSSPMSMFAAAINKSALVLRRVGTPESEIFRPVDCFQSRPRTRRPREGTIEEKAQQ